jgi:hypothetical protein
MPPKTLHLHPPTTSPAAPPWPKPFRLVRVEKAATPEGGNGETWYRYVLENGRSAIMGQRCGNRKDVIAYAVHYLEQLNTRTANGGAAWAPRARKPRRRS